MLSVNKPSKPNGIVETFVKAMVVIFVLIILAAVLFVGYKLINNSAQQQARIMGAYAKQHHLIKFRTNGDSGIGPDNTIPWYTAYYRTTEQASSLKSNLESLLKSNGYSIKDNFYNPAPCNGGDGITPPWDGNPKPPICPPVGEGGGAPSNGGQPYWVIWGAHNNTTVSAEITNISYSSTDSSYKSDMYKNLNTEHSVPRGYIVLNITFSLH